MRALTPTEEAILKSKSMVGDSAFSGRIEIDVPVTTGTTGDVALLYGTASAHADQGSDAAVDPTISPVNATYINDGDAVSYSQWPAFVGGVFNEDRTYRAHWIVDLGTAFTVTQVEAVDTTSFGGELITVLWYSDTGDDDDWTDASATFTPTTGTGQIMDFSPFTARYVRVTMSASGHSFFYVAGGQIQSLIIRAEVSETTIATTILRPTRISIDKSRKMAAAVLDFTITNEDGTFSRYPDQDVLLEDRVIRCFEGYGDEADWLKTFTGLIDKPHEHRDTRWISVSCRDRMKLLLVQNFQTTAPQGADESGAVRTPANGVYLNMEVSDIVEDILDRAGITTADRLISATSYMVDEYVISDGTSWAEAISGTDRLTDLVGYELLADEDGVIVFRPISADNSSDTDTPQEPDYTFRVGEDLIVMDLEGDDYDLKTRVKAIGPYTTAKPAWAETWHTNIIKKPVGLFYDPADPTHLYVLDRSTSKLYKLLQSDRSIVSSTSFSGISYPLGISGDPSDATIVWILNAPWRYTGSTTGNSIKKVRRSDGVTLATYSLADGRWTTIKVSAANIWLGNWDTDKVHKHSKVDGSSVASYTVTYAAVAQTNPTGIAIDGTTLLTFFYGMSGGNRFLLVDESDPTTVDTSNALGVTSGVISTAGTKILGGEMDTTTHADLYACSDDLGLVWKFALTTPVTNDVAVVVADQELEDLLGARSFTEAREHDLHPGDADHSFEIRRATLSLKVVTSIAQATESATRALNRLSQFRLVLDAGVVGNPALQLGDMIAVEDLLSGLDEDEKHWVLDTYRTDLDAAAGTYIGTVSLLPWNPSY